MFKGGNQSIEDKPKTSLCDHRIDVWIFITVLTSGNWEQVFSAELNQNFQPAFIPLPTSGTWEYLPEAPAKANDNRGKIASWKYLCGFDNPWQSRVSKLLMPHLLQSSVSHFVGKESRLSVVGKSGKKKMSVSDSSSVSPLCRSILNYTICLRTISSLCLRASFLKIKIYFFERNDERKQPWSYRSRRWWAVLINTIWKHKHGWECLCYFDSI